MSWAVDFLRKKPGQETGTLVAIYAPGTPDEFTYREEVNYKADAATIDGFVARAKAKRDERLAEPCCTKALGQWLDSVKAKLEAGE